MWTGPRLTVRTLEQAWPALTQAARTWWPAAPSTVGYLELHLLVLLKAAEAVAIELGIVHEHARAIRAGNKAVARLRVQPLDGSL